MHLTCTPWHNTAPALLEQPHCEQGQGTDPEKQTSVKTLLLIPTLSSAITEHPPVLEKSGC